MLGLYAYGDLKLRADQHEPVDNHYVAELAHIGPAGKTRLIDSAIVESAGDPREAAWPVFGLEPRPDYQVRVRKATSFDLKIHKRSRANQ